MEVFFHPQYVQWWRMWILEPLKVWTLILAVSRCVTFAKLLNLSKPSFFFPDTVYLCRGLWQRNENVTTDYLE